MEIAKLRELFTQGFAQEKAAELKEMNERHAELLNDQQEELDMWKDISNVLIKQERELAHEVQEAKRAAVEVFGKAANIIKSVANVLPDLPMAEIRVKWVGALDSDVWERAIPATQGGERGRQGAGLADLFSKWEERIRDPELDIWRSVPVPQEGVDPLLWPRQRVVNHAHPALVELRGLHPPEVAKDVIEATKLLDEYNPAGRYPVPMVWHHTERRPATMAEVIQYLGALLEATEDLQ